MSSLPLPQRAVVALLAFAALAVTALVNFDLVYRGMLTLPPHEPKYAGIATALIVGDELFMATFLLDFLGVSRFSSSVVDDLFSRQARVWLTWLSGIFLASNTLTQFLLVYYASLNHGAVFGPGGTGLIPLDYRSDLAVWALALLLPLGFVPLMLVLSRALWPIGGPGGTALPGAAE